MITPLDPPNTIEGDPNATELLRLWAAHNKLNVRINVGRHHEMGIDEAEAWGIIAADFARHVGRALEQRYAMPQIQTIAKFRRAFLAELDSPTTDYFGE